MTNFVLLIALLIWIPVASRAIGYFSLYRSRVKDAKDPSQYPNVVIPAEVRALIDRFDPNIKVMVSTEPRLIARAISYNSYPAYIVFSKQLLEHSPDAPSYFDKDDLVAITAHELGHIIPKSHMTWSVSLIASGIVPAVLAAVMMPTLSSFMFLALLLAWFGSISREEEYLADSFAVGEAGISVAQFSKTLAKFEHYISFKRPYVIKQREYIVGTFLWLFFKSHPSTEKRISRLRILYGEELK